MTPKFYELLQRCVEDGVQRGWNRAHKHMSPPPEHAVRAAIEEAVMLEIHEWFTFPDPPQPGA